VDFYEYLGLKGPMYDAGFKTAYIELQSYIEKGLLTKQSHKTLPLDIYCYGRTAVYTNVWDNITSKCRGIVVDRETNEIVARPFEKFHNYNRTAEQDENVTAAVKDGARVYFWEKMDGFMLTRFEYRGLVIVTSKSSFESIHAKWGRAEVGNTVDFWPPNTTAVFEGISPNFRIVVDYGKRNELVLLAVIDNETGDEMEPAELREWARKNGLRIPSFFTGTVSEFYTKINREHEGTNLEGFVATWYPEDGGVPYRLKLKYLEYMRLHRMITGISPKQISKLIEDGMVTELNMLHNDTTPWMAKFVDRWVHALETEYESIKARSTEAYVNSKEVVRVKVGQRPYENMGQERKAWAAEFTRPENKQYSPILFHMLDGRDPAPVIWEMVRRKLTVGKGPLVQNY